MRIVIACVEQETNSFSPIPSPLSRFGRGPGPYYGQAALEEYKDSRISFAALVVAAKSWGAEIDVPIVARCHTGAPVADVDFESIIEPILESVRKGCDAILLGLHGAMLTQSGEDEGLLLERLRELSPETPIGVAWDFHGTMNARKVENMTFGVCYKTSPHTDIYETGEHVARLMRATLDGKVSPATAWGNMPVIGDSACMTTSHPAMAEVMAMAADAEKNPKVLACSVFGGCDVSDTPGSGPSCVVVTDGDPDLATAICDRIRTAMWARRDMFLYRPSLLDEAVARAATIKSSGTSGPVILTDNSDSCNAGATTDDMTVVREVMKQGLRDVAVAPIRDAEVAALMHKAGNGATLTVDLGHKVKPVYGAHYEPMRFTGTVSGLSDGDLVVTGPVFTGTRRDMGPCGCLTCGDIQFVVTSERVEPFDLGVFELVDIDPKKKRFLVLKGYGAFAPVYEPFAADIIHCRGTGAAKTVLELAGTYKTLRRPIYPLDDNVTFDLRSE